jgi:hypothetical protein
METNIFPILFDFKNFQVRRIEFSEEKLNELRNQYNQSHSFFRNGGYIYVSNNSHDQDINIGDTVSLSVIENSEVTASLIKHIFFRTFKDRFPHIIPTDFYPFRIFSTQAKDDLVRDLLPDDLKDVLSYKKQIEVQLRLFEGVSEKFFGFVITTSRRWILNKTCQDLINEHYDLLGKEVLHCELLPGMENILAPNEEFIGIIKTINGSIATVETNDGDQEINLDELTIRKTKQNIQDYLIFRLSEDRAEAIFNQIGQKRKEFLDPQYERKELLSISKMLSIDTTDKSFITYQNKEGFCFTVSNLPYQPNNAYNLGTPTFVFDPAAIRTDAKLPDRGLTNFGPYDSLTFDVKAPHFLAICAKENRGSFTTFLANLTDGLPTSSFFKKGLKKKYDFSDMTYDIVEVSQYSSIEYENLISKIDKKPDLAIIEIPESFRSLPDNENPYYRIKAKLLLLEIPVQFILSRKVQKHDEYLLNSISLQLYAKLGGTPWVLASNKSVDREIVIGLGHSILRSNSYSGAEQTRVVGISTFFTGDGQYLLSNKAKDVSYEEYFNELLASLNDSFENLKNEQGWKNGDTIRLIFHIFKPIRNIEFDVVSELIRKYKDFKVQFAFVTISKKHPFLLFDPNQPGVRKYNDSSELKGKFVPERGKNIILDSSSCLVQMLGPKEIKSDNHGASNPILVKIRLPQGNYDASSIEDLLFTDLNYITQQLYSFSYLSWRGFLPGELPATMLYSGLISKLLGKLRRIEGWQPSVLNFTLKRKKWFL